MNDDDNEAISDVKTILQEQLTNRFELDSLDADSLPVLASLLDPRFKNTRFFPDAEDKQVAKSALLALMRTERALWTRQHQVMPARWIHHLLKGMRLPLTGMRSA